MNCLKWSKRLILLSVWPVLAACCQCAVPTTPSVTLDRNQAARQEQVSATLEGLNGTEATVTVTGLEARVLSRSENEVVFEVPERAPAGPQTAQVQAEGKVAQSRLTIFGDDVIEGKVTVLLARDIPENELQSRLRAINPQFTLERVRSLNTLGVALEPSNPCAGGLAEIDVGGTPLGQALEELRRLEQDDPDLILHIDPRSGPNVGAIDPLGAIGARTAQLGRGLTGAGTLIAILDTGVSDHPELAGRIRTGYNAIDNSANVADGYALESAGHGTPAAVLTAGSTLGVAPGAEILPVKVCDDGGSCLSSNVIVGTCYALAAALQDGKLGQLVLNYSLGGETEIGALTAILGYALERNALVAASGGNEGDPRDFPQPAPRHYPAASRLAGLVAVAALSAGEAPQCVTFESVPPIDTDALFSVGESFVDGGATVSFAPFTLGGGGTVEDGAAYADAGGSAFGSGQYLWTNNILASFDFAGPLGGLTLAFSDFGGSENLLVNGQLLNVDDFGELPGSVGGVVVSASGEGSSGQGIGGLTLLGPLRSFGIGGQEFALDDVCPVQGAEADWQPALFSTRGDYLDLAAPGDGVTSGAPSGGLASYSGTSFAAPIVAGALALWREAEPSMSPADIEQALTNAARALPYPAEAVGAGMLELGTRP